MATILSALEPAIMQNRGARFEADIFSILLQIPDILRAFEFATVDGAIDLNAPARSSTVSFAYRFWDLDEHLRNDPDTARLVPFDVKSSTSGYAEGQKYLTTVEQKRAVAFYIGICAADPSYVELIPNLSPPPTSSGLSKLSAGKDRPGRYISSNTVRTPLLGPSAYGRLNPCNAPHRMPLSFLGEAIGRVRDCALGKGDYINPWTLCRYFDWKPQTILPSNTLLRPIESSEHFTGYLGILEICRSVRIASYLYKLPVTFDFVDLQPRLADFKMIFDKDRQVFVQYKIDGRDRAIETPLTNVAIARGTGDTCRWYFTPYDRFDFLFYQFDFSNRPFADTLPHMYCIPERHIPDHFYTTNDIETSFEVPAFRPFRVPMDKDGRWMGRVFEIMNGEPQPRKPGNRPQRDVKLNTATSLVIRKALNDMPKEVQLRWDVLSRFHQRFFYTIMARCAARSSGLLLVLAPKHPMGDFAYCPYRWTPEEQEAFRTSLKPPRTLHELPAATPVVLMYAYAKDSEVGSRGPFLTSPQFRRVNSSRSHRLLIFDPLGPESSSLSSFGPLYVVPSEDISPTPSQLDIHLGNLKKDKRYQFTARVPLLSQLLHTGRAISDYVISSCGPLLYSDNEAEGWRQVWELLDRFAGVEPFEYPALITRQPAEYHATIHLLHQRLAEEFNRGHYTAGIVVNDET